MKTTISSVLLPVLMFAALQVQADIYRYVDENGQVTFRDAPKPGVTPVQVYTLPKTPEPPPPKAALATHARNLGLDPKKFSSTVERDQAAPAPSPAVAPPGHYSLDELRQANPGWSDADLIAEGAKRMNLTPQQFAQYIGLDSAQFASIIHGNEGAATSTASTSGADRNVDLWSALLWGSVAAVLGGGVGYLWRRVITPRRPVATPHDVARSWLAWAGFVACVASLPRFFIRLNVDAFAGWLVLLVLSAVGAYILGFVYGKFKFSRPTCPASPAGNQPKSPTLAPDASAPFATTPNVSDSCDKDHIYARVAEEIESGNTDKGLWTRLWAECGGDDIKTKVLYIKYRANALGEKV
ncbi:MAG: DUF4124 domain-containing protein [Thiobacillaceae bacterium]